MPRSLATTRRPGADGVGRRARRLRDARPGLPRRHPVRPGISVLLTDSIHLIRGKRVGLITNQTGVDEHGRVGHRAAALRRGARGAAFSSSAFSLPSTASVARRTASTSPAASTSGAGCSSTPSTATATIGPPDSTLRDLDVLVVDLQDIGTRTWTYVGAMLYAMQAAARRGIPIVVLDRPNPLSGLHPDGPILDSALANPNEPTPVAAGARVRALSDRRCVTRSRWASWRATSTPS